jgi:hypothetical protein
MFVPPTPPEPARLAPPWAPIPPAPPERDRRPKSSRRKKKSGTDPFVRFSMAVTQPIKDVIGPAISDEELADFVESLYGIWWTGRAAQARQFPHPGFDSIRNKAPSCLRQCNDLSDDPSSDSG